MLHCNYSSENLPRFRSLFLRYHDAMNEYMYVMFLQMNDTHHHDSAVLRVYASFFLFCPYFQGVTCELRALAASLSRLAVGDVIAWRSVSRSTKRLVGVEVDAT